MNEKEFNKEKFNMVIDEHKKDSVKAVKAFTNLVVSEAIKYYGKKNLGFGDFNESKSYTKTGKNLQKQKRV